MNNTLCESPLSASSSSDEALRFGTRQFLLSTTVHRFVSAAVALLGTCTGFAAEVSTFTTPDAWTRGSAFSTYYGWDVFEQPAGSLLNDSTPDLNPFGITGVSMVQQNTDFGNITSTNNLYAGFAPTNRFNITTGVRTAGTQGAGFTTVLVQVAGTGAASRLQPTEFTIAGAAPGKAVKGVNEAGAEQLWMEWQITGNQALYDLRLVGGTNHATIGALTIDTSWRASNSLSNTAPTAIVPEPSAVTLTLCATMGLLALSRRRRSALSR